MAKHRNVYFLSALDPEAEENIILVKNETGFQNSGYSVIASSIRFNLISEFRNRQLKPDTLHDLNARHLKKVTIKSYTCTCLHCPSSKYTLYALVTVIWSFPKASM